MKIPRILNWEPVFRFAKKYTKELIIAFALAVVAAAIYEPSKECFLKSRLETASKAVATLLIYDSNRNLVGTASGVFISSEGTLVTNYHVLETKNLSSIVARLKTGASYDYIAPIGSSKQHDLAILTFDAKEVPFINVQNDLKAEMGEHIMTIGSPKGLEQTISEGIVSYPEREIEGIDLIQFTAPISPGSSGGGLFNKWGHILGVTTSSLSTRNTQNINFAVPVKYIKRIVRKEPEIAKGSAEYYYAEGVMNADNKEYMKAEENLQEALRINPHYKNAYTKLGEVFYVTERYEEGVKILEHGQSLLPDDPDIYFALANAYEDVGRYDDAIAAYKKVLKLNSENEENKDSLYYLCILNICLGRDEQVKQFLPNLRLRDPGLAKEIDMLLSRISN
jgi:hypothetical protein